MKPVIIQFVPNPRLADHKLITLKHIDGNMVTAVQIVIFLLFVFGIFFAIIMYCKTCSSLCKASDPRYSSSSALQPGCDDERTDSQSLPYIISDSRDRPPSYSEACSAPPLYGCPFNRASMLEAPPVYPETPKSSDKVLHEINQPFEVTHHI